MVYFQGAALQSGGGGSGCLSPAPGSRTHPSSASFSSPTDSQSFAVVPSGWRNRDILTFGMGREMKSQCWEEMAAAAAAAN